MPRDIDEFIASLAEPASLDALRDATFRYLSKFDVSIFTYHHFAPLGAVDHRPSIRIASIGIPEKWAKTYMENRFYEVDPLIRRGNSQTRPIWWTDLFQIEARGARERAYVEGLRAADLGEGLAIPVFGPNGRNGFVTIGLPDDARENKSISANDLQWACQLMHLRYCEILQVRQENSVNLSTRERSALALIARSPSRAAWD